MFASLSLLPVLTLYLTFEIEPIFMVVRTTGTITEYNFSAGPYFA